MSFEELLQASDAELLDFRSELFDRVELIERDSDPGAAIEADVRRVHAVLALRQIGVLNGADPVRFVECLLALERARRQLGTDTSLEESIETALGLARQQTTNEGLTDE